MANVPFRSIVQTGDRVTRRLAEPLWKLFLSAVPLSGQPEIRHLEIRLHADAAFAEEEFRGRGAIDLSAGDDRDALDGGLRREDHVALAIIWPQ